MAQPTGDALTDAASSTSNQRSAQALLWGLLATAALLAADLGTKEWALDRLSMPRTSEATPPVCRPAADGNTYFQRHRAEPIVLLPNYLEFRYAENCGAAFGLLRDAHSWVRAAVFGIAAIVASAVLLWMFVQGRGGSMFAYSVPLIVSGALGNIADRVRHGFVVDFIRFHWRDAWEYPTFNVADITITIGVGLLVLDGFLEERQQKRQKAAATRRTAKAS